MITLKFRPPQTFHFGVLKQRKAVVKYTRSHLATSFLWILPVKFSILNSRKYKSRMLVLQMLFESFKVLTFFWIVRSFSENCPTHGIADPIIDSVSTESSTFANFLPSQEKDQLYFPSVPDFTQEVSDHLLNFCSFTVDDYCFKYFFPDTNDLCLDLYLQEFLIIVFLFSFRCTWYISRKQ